MSRNGRIVVVSYDVIPVSPIVTTSTLVYDDQSVNTTFTGTLSVERSVCDRGHICVNLTRTGIQLNQYIRLTTDALNGQLVPHIGN